MSIIRNSANTSDLAVKLVTFGTHGEVPYTDTDGNYMHKTNLFANTYCAFDGDGYFKTEHYVGTKCAIILNVYLAAGISGPIFGNAGSAAADNISIGAGDGKLYYIYGDLTDIVEQAYTPGWHIIGFFPSGTGVKCVYDGAMFGSVITRSINRLKLTIGKSNGSTGAVTNIAKVFTTEYLDTTSTTPHIHEYYPVTSTKPNLRDETPKPNLPCTWYETREKQDVVTAQSTSAGTASGTAADYGISMDDLRTVLGSGYRNLMGIMTQDGGINTAVGFTESTARAAYTVEKEIGGETVTRDFAFNLAGMWVVDGTESGTTQWPVSGKGLLIRGRKPVYNIFHDAIKHGFYVEDDGTATPRYNLRFNTLKVLGTNHDRVDMAWMEGYSTSKDEVHYPAVQLGSDVGSGLKFVNGRPYVVDSDNLFINGGDTTTPFKPETSLYIESKTAAGKVKAKLGNLAPWNFTETELANNDWNVAGWAVQVNIIGDIPVAQAVKTIASGYLSKSSTDAVKTLWRDTMQEVDSVIDMTNSQYLFYELHRGAQRSQSETYKWNAFLANAVLTNFRLVKPTGIGKTFLQLEDSDMINIQDLIPSKYQSDLSATLTYGRYQIIDHTGEGTDTTPVSIISRSSSPSYFIATLQDGRKALYTGLYAGWNASTQKPAFTTDIRFIAKIEMFWCNAMPAEGQAQTAPEIIGYRCELVTSRTYKEEEQGGRFYPQAASGNYWSGWQHWLGTSNKSGSVSSYSDVQSYSHNFDLWFDEYFGVGHDRLPDADVDGLPKNTLTRLVIYDADKAPIACPFYGNENFCQENGTPEFYTASKVVIAYKPCLDVIESLSSVCAEWRMKYYNRNSSTGVYTDAGGDAATFIDGMKIKITRIYYEHNGQTGDLSRMERKTEVFTVTLSSEYTTYNVGGTSRDPYFVLHIDGSYVATYEIWIHPGTNLHLEGENFVKYTLVPASGSTHYKRGDTFILEFTN